MKFFRLLIVALLLLGLFAACGQKAEVKEGVPEVEGPSEDVVDTLATEEVIEQPAEEAAE